MTETGSELARLGPYTFQTGDFNPDTDTLRLGNTTGDGWTAPSGDTVFMMDGRVGGLIIHRYQERLAEGPVEVELPPTPGDPEKRSWFLSMGAYPGGMCC